MTQDSASVLVTGGAGYIGSHTCKALARAGLTPVVYDSLCRGNAWAVKWGPLEVGDLMDGERLRDVIRAYRPIGVIHFQGKDYQIGHGQEGDVTRRLRTTLCEIHTGTSERHPEWIEPVPTFEIV